MTEHTEQPGPARLFLLLVGAALVIGGVGGFFYEASFGTGGSYAADDILGAFPTNGWDNLLHLAAGLACLASASRAPRPAALAVGSLFTLLAVWGLLASDRGTGSLLELIPVGTADNLLHLAVGLSGIAAALLRTDPSPPARA